MTTVRQTSVQQAAGHQVADEVVTGGAPSGDPAARIAFVQSEWHADLVDRCRDAFLAEITHLGVTADRVDLFRVPGAFEIPPWDSASQALVRQHLIALAATLPDTKRMFGRKEEVDPVRRLIGAASATVTFPARRNSPSAVRSSTRWSSPCRCCNRCRRRL